MTVQITDGGEYDDQQHEIDLLFQHPFQRRLEKNPGHAAQRSRRDVEIRSIAQAFQETECGDPVKSEPDEQQQQARDAAFRADQQVDGFHDAVLVVLLVVLALAVAAVLIRRVDFDAPVVIRPATINTTIWNKFLELAFGDFAKLIAPKKVVFCEGTIQGRAYKNFDAQVYGRIFSAKYPDVSFVSIGSCSELEDENNISMKIVSQVLKNSSIIKIVDRDDKSPEEINELKAKGIKVLSKRHIESYLWDDEVIILLCKSLNKEDKTEDCLMAKSRSIADSVERGHPIDDIKSASGMFYTEVKRILSLTKCGNTKEAFLRDTIVPLISEDTRTYKELEIEIFK